MVPFDAFSTEAPHSSIAFCSGCDGGTQCESLSSTGLSWVSPAQGQASASAAPSANAPDFIETPSRTAGSGGKAVPTPNIERGRAKYAEHRVSPGANGARSAAAIDRRGG